jgi:hypothetical protein
MSKLPVAGTVWVSPRMIFARDVSLRLTASAQEVIQYSKRDLSTPDPNDWNWMEPERVESFTWSIDNESEITVSISLDISQNRTDLSRSVALAFASIPNQIRGSQNYDIAVDDRDGGYYETAANKIILGHEQTLSDITDGFLEEVLTHEVAHAELDKYFYGTSGWSNAVFLDAGRFISEYAGDNPSREDVAETILPLAAILSVDPARLTPADKAYLLESAAWVPGRYAYLSEQVFGNSVDFSQRLTSLQEPITGGGSPYVLRRDSVTRITTFDITEDTIDIPDELTGTLKGSSLYSISAPTYPGMEATKKEWKAYKTVLKKTKTLEKKIGQTGDAFAYKQSTGEFFVDTNGKQKGFGEGGLLAVLENQPLLGTSNIDF